MAAEQLEQAVLNSLRQLRNSTVTSTLYDDVVGFYHAINWTERWLHALGLFHVVIWLLVIATRRSNEMQMGLLIFVLGMVYCSEWLNRWGAEHWKDFATQNYFDKHGVFISVVFSAPLLLVAFGILIHTLRSAARLLIEVKKLQFQKEKKAQERRKNKGPKLATHSEEGKKDL